MTRLALTLALVLMAQAALAFWEAPAMQARAQAQAAFTVVASGLDAPRGMVFGPDGSLYIADGGSGGDEEAEWVPPFRTARIGTSGRILRLDGSQTAVVASGIQSLSLGPAQEVVGPQDLAFVGSTLYAVVGQMNPLPGGRETHSLLVKVNPDGRTETVADLGRYERENNPDETVPDSNPFGLAAGPDGNLYVAEAGANASLTVTPSGEVSTFVVWNDNPVPTAIAFDRNGQAHVGFLSRAPFATGSARVERVVDGAPSVLVPNLTTVVDIEFGPDGALYILEHAAEFVTAPPPGYRPASGRVLRVTPDGTQPVVTGLDVPTKIAFGPDGALYVTNRATRPGKVGEVLKITLPAAGASAVAIPAPPAPAAAAQPSPAAKPAGAPAAAPSPAPAAKPAAPSQAPAPAAKPAAAASPAPAQAPRSLPRTGIGPDLAAVAGPVAAIGAAFLLAGLGLRRRRR